MLNVAALEKKCIWSDTNFLRILEVAFGVEVLLLVGDGCGLLLDSPALVMMYVFGVRQGSHCSHNNEEYLELLHHGKLLW